MTPSMKRASEDLKLDKLLVVYPGSLSFPLDRNMNVLSLDDLSGFSSYSERSYVWGSYGFFTWLIDLNMLISTQ